MHGFSEAAKTSSFFLSVCEQPFATSVSQAPVRAAVLPPVAMLVVAGSYEHTLFGLEYTEHQSRPRLELCFVHTSHDATIRTAAVDAESKYLVSGGADEAIRLLIDLLCCVFAFYFVCFALCCSVSLYIFYICWNN